MTTQDNEQFKASLKNKEFTFFCPECNSRKNMLKSEIGKEVECKECCETVKIDYPETRPCPKCKKSIKLKARVCKYCKQRVMPFVDPLTIQPISKREAPSKIKHSKLKIILFSIIRMALGFVIGLYATRAIARMTQHSISSNADYIIAIILAIYLPIHFLKAKK